MHVVVIGAGIVGASIADQLAARGARVTVIDRAGPGAGASGMSFGWINAAASESDSYFRFRLAAVARFRSLCDTLDLSDAVTWNGCIWWEDEGEAFETHLDAMARWGYDVSLIGPDEFTRLEPNVANPPTRAIWCPSEGAAEPDKVARALLRRATASGARLILGREVTGLTRTGDRVTGIETDLGPMSADLVVVAAGIRSGMLTGLPMNNRPGLILRTAPIAPVISRIVMSSDIHFRQASDGRLYMGEIFSGGIATETLDFASGLIDELMARLRRRLPGVADLHLEQAALGTRPVPADGFPAIGPVPSQDGLYLATMHSGVTLGPLVGELVAREVVEQDSDPLLDLYRPERFF